MKNNIRHLFVILISCLAFGSIPLPNRAERKEVIQEINLELSKCGKLPYTKKDGDFYSRCNDKILDSTNRSRYLVRIKGENVLFKGAYSHDYDKRELFHYVVLNKKLDLKFHSKDHLKMRQYCLKNKDTGCTNIKDSIFIETSYEPISTRLLLDSLNYCGALPELSRHMYSLPCEVKKKGVGNLGKYSKNNYYDKENHLYAFFSPEVNFYEFVHVKIRKYNGIYTAEKTITLKNKEEIIKYCKNNKYVKCSSLPILDIAMKKWKLE